jgi:hypothetical protein
MVAWKATAWSALCISSWSFSVSVKMKSLASGLEWWLTTVYDPSHDVDKPSFISELHDLRQLCSRLWLLAGNFNLIYRAEDKNNADSTVDGWDNSGASSMRQV